MDRTPADALSGRRPRPWQSWLATPWPATLLGVLCFINTLSNDFVYDDRALVLDNPRIQSLTNWHAIWLSDWWQVLEDDGGDSGGRDRLYRPLTLCSFAVNYALHGLSPVGYHLGNILLHGLACLLLWHAARRVLADAATASLATALFAVHPVHAEAVANIVGRAEILAAVFLLLGMLVLLPRDGVPSLGRTVAGAAAFFAALLAKETAVCFPAIALLVLYLQPACRRQPVRWWLLRAACLVPPLVIYFPLRYVALGHQLIRSAPVETLMNPLIAALPADRVVGSATILGSYARLLLVPNRLSCDYGLAVVNPAGGVTAATLMGFLTLAGLVVAMVGFVRRTPRWHVLAVLTAMLIASYALISNTVLLIGVSLAERLMYWPSALVVMMAGLGLVAFWRRHCTVGGRLEPRARLLAVLGVAVLAALGLRTVTRNADWRTNATLFARDVVTCPASAQLNKCHAVELVREAKAATDPAACNGLLLAAETYLARATRIDPGYAEAWLWRGKVVAELGDLHQAQQYLESALLLRPSHQDTRETLAKVQYQGGETDRLDPLRAAVAAEPDNPARRLALGNALLDLGRHAEAREQLARAAELAPDDPVILRQWGKSLLFPEPDPRVLDVFRRVMELKPNDWETHLNLSTLLAETDPASSLEHAKRAIELQPDDWRTHANLAEALALNGRIDEALDIYRPLERSLPSDDPYRNVIHARIERLEHERH